VALTPEDRKVLNRARKDQEHRDYLEQERTRFWRWLQLRTAVLGTCIGIALAVAKFLHL